jgi:hypothetical protein
MQRLPVSSSNIASIGYDAQSETLEVEFLDGSVYQYFNVPSGTYEGLMADSSHGSYLNSHVKGTYQYQKL